MKKQLIMVLFTVAVTVVFVAPICLAYLLTKPIVTLNEEVFLKQAVLYAAGAALPATKQEIVALFDRRVSVVPGGDPRNPVYEVKAEDGSRAGWVLTRRGPGLWGEIAMVVGFAADRQALTGIDFLAQSETPGLGARIAEPWFKEQFRGKRGPFTTVGEGEAAAENQFDAITGATTSSNAVRLIVNAAVSQAAGLAP